MVSGFQLVTMCAIIDSDFEVRVTDGCSFDNRLDMLDIMSFQEGQSNHPPVRSSPISRLTESREKDLLGDILLPFFRISLHQGPPPLLARWVAKSSIHHNRSQPFDLF